MKFSRFVFGIGGESLAVAQNTYASAWFRGDVLNMVFGLQLSIARVGSSVNFQVVGPLYAALEKSFSLTTALGWTLTIAGISTVISLFSAVVSIKVIDHAFMYFHGILYDHLVFHGISFVNLWLSYCRCLDLWIRGEKD